MNNKIEYDNLSKKVIEIEVLTNQVKEAFSRMDTLIEENINSGKGIWDGSGAAEYRQKWNQMKEEIPSSLEQFQILENNLKNTIEMMKKSEEE